MKTNCQIDLDRTLGGINLVVLCRDPLRTLTSPRFVVFHLPQQEVCTFASARGLAGTSKQVNMYGISFKAGQKHPTNHHGSLRTVPPRTVGLAVQTNELVISRMSPVIFQTQQACAAAAKARRVDTFTAPRMQPMFSCTLFRKHCSRPIHP